MMNERIKELAEQSGAQFFPAITDYFGDTHPAGVLTVKVDLEKFAELIVRECVNKIGNEYKESLDDTREDWDRGYLGGLSRAIHAVQEHFGVEE